MSSREGVVLTTARKDHGPVKPEPPEDLWERMDEIVEECRISLARPAESFTRTEFAKRYNISQDQASKRLRKLRDAGKIKPVLNGASSYYVLVKP